MAEYEAVITEPGGSTVLERNRLTVVQLAASTVDDISVSKHSKVTDNVQEAIKAWKLILQAGGEVVEDRRNGRFEENTIGIVRRVPLALIPASTEQLPRILKVANEFGIPLYPVSTGKNWGYGSGCPVDEHAVILDLSRLNKILDFDEELGLVTVQPGVTQQHLADFLNERKLPFLVPTTGAGPSASLLGNAMERGYGITPCADHFAALTSLQAVLVDGSIYRSALTEMGGGAVDRAHKWGLGPYLDGLFTQGAFGVVTEATFALVRRPERVEAFFCSVRCEEDLEAVVHGIRELLRDLPGVSGSINIMNDRRMLSMMEPYPYSQTPAGEAIPDGIIKQMAKRQWITPWTMAGALYGSKELVAVARKKVRRVVREYSKRLVFLTPGKIRLAKRIMDALPRLRNSRWAQALDCVEAGVEIMNGCPSEVALPLTYWRSRKEAPKGKAMNPARDGCGLIWYAPLIPMKGEQVRSFVNMVDRICNAHGMNPLITLTSLSDRCFDSTIPLLFDRDDPEECARAKACFEALFEAGRTEGFLPYRLGVDSMKKLKRNGSVFWETVWRMKKTMDPNNILAPGRYAPSD